MVIEFVRYNFNSFKFRHKYSIRRHGIFEQIFTSVVEFLPLNEGLTKTLCQPVYYVGYLDYIVFMIALSDRRVRYLPARSGRPAV
jgi:hypothetical protein